MPSLFSALQAVLKRWFGAPSQQPMSADAPASEISANDLQNTSMQAEEYTQNPSQIVPYDENLLERSRTQWQFGDWESLAQLSRDTLQHHPDRAKLALLAAAGLLQQGDADTARQFIRLAQDWGVSKKLISQILVAGVHNSLARAAAVGGQEQRALGHFENAIATGMPGGDTKLLLQARSDQQTRQLAEGKRLIMHSHETAQSTTRGLNSDNKIVSDTRNKSVAAPQTIKLETTGANILINGITLTEQSKKRWPYFLKIEEIQISVFLTLVKEINPAFFFDIGANVGFYTLIAQKYFPYLRCFSFEPTPDTYANLVQNLKANCRTGKVDAMQIALSSQHGIVQFGDFGDCSGKNAILSTSIHDEKDIKKIFSVDMNTLDHLYPNKIGRIIVKIDTEGHEMDVLKGGLDFFAINEFVLQVETGHKDNSEELDKLIRSFSLSLLFRLGPDSYYTNISSLLTDSKPSEILERANQFVISHRWDQELELGQ